MSLKDFEAYDWRVGRWSRLIGTVFLEWLEQPPGLRWLDIGCGSGALSRAVHDIADPERLDGIDPSAASVAAAEKALAEERVVFHRAAAEALPFAPDTFHVAVSGLALNFMNNPGEALREISRVVVPGGCIAAYVWDFAGEMQVFRRFWDAARVIDPRAAVQDHGALYPLCRRGRLHRLFMDSGLVEVQQRALEVEAEFPDFETYWGALLAPDAAVGRYLAALPESRRSAIRDRLVESLPIRDDGGFNLRMRAWAVRGCR